MKKATIQIAFELGTTAKKNGETIYSNPYSPLEEEELFDSWMDGWYDGKYDNRSPSTSHETKFIKRI